MTATRQPSPYDAVVFAGGGCRCVWQVGFWKVVAPALELRPSVIGAVSAGAAMACMVVSGLSEPTLDYFKARTAANPRNVYPLNWLRGEPMFPHAGIYRDTVLAHLDVPGLARLHDGPDLRVLVARMPTWTGPRGGTLLAMLLYQADQLAGARVHGRFGRHVGFVPEWVSIRECRTPEDVADLILQSSCTPPFTPLYRRGDRPVLDGGLIDSAPVEIVPAGVSTLVLLTKARAALGLPQVEGRTYVQPSEEIPVYKWDYTSPKLVQETFDMGRRDGERFVATFEAQSHVISHGASDATPGAAAQGATTSP